MNIRIETDVEKVKFADVIQLYSSNDWGIDKDYLEEHVKGTFSNSTYSLFAFDKDKLVGFIRVFSDNFQTTWISEIVIHPDEQKKGVGSILLSRIIEKYGHTSIYAETFEGKEVFFEK
ncbi:MAG: GNAT family N-acetyltransferase, partial [Bacteroidales bacterium]|nr:GNAT family N-acetyltransferase [Bacteroidales bacterium]